MGHPKPNDPDDPAWALPLHGAEVPSADSAPPDLTADPYLRADDEIPPTDFQPRLSRFGEAA